jgi:Resolvase, N terminal domain
MRMAAIYARVSSEQQREENTIASQTASLIEFASSHDLEVPGEWVFEDEGYSGATLERPGLERVRDLAAEGQIPAVLAYAPDRLSRKYAYQILLIEEFARHGVETLFVKSPQGDSAEDQLLVQFQGMIAEYERAQISRKPPRSGRGGSFFLTSLFIELIEKWPTSVVTRACGSQWWPRLAPIWGCSAISRTPLNVTCDGIRRRPRRTHPEQCDGGSAAAPRLKPHDCVCFRRIISFDNF